MISEPSHGERESRVQIVSWQQDRLASLLAEIYGANSFYTHKFDGLGINPNALAPADILAALPLTTKQELAADQLRNPPWGTAYTYPLDRYTRYHQTSSTTGYPLRWLDTDESWQWVIDCWKAVYRAAHVTETDTIFFPFGFGPFLGFWSAFDAGTQIGALCISGGGMSSETRLNLLHTVRPTVICCTPSYALRLIEVAQKAGLPDLARTTVNTVIVAGEPGGNIPTTRAKIQEGWGARVIDHHGLTETGPVSFECLEVPGSLHLNERDFVCEVIDPNSTDPVSTGDAGELVITNLGRAASPVFRYRTRDIVRITPDPCKCGRTLARIEGGILSRTDDMVCVRGVNVYPTAVESVLRGFPEVLEYRSTISTRDALLDLTIELELVSNIQDPDTLRLRIAQALREAMGISVPLTIVEPGTLPRFEMKARRFVIEGPPHL